MKAVELVLPDVVQDVRHVEDALTLVRDVLEAVRDVVPTAHHSAKDVRAAVEVVVPEDAEETVRVDVSRVQDMLLEPAVELPIVVLLVSVSVQVALVRQLLSLPHQRVLVVIHHAPAHVLVYRTRLAVALHVEVSAALHVQAHPIPLIITLEHVV